MSAAIMCDHCGAALAVDRNGEDENGETAGWIRIGTTYQTFDACTIACAEQLLAGPVGDVSRAALESVAEVARVIREDREGRTGPEEPT